LLALPLNFGSVGLYYFSTGVPYEPFLIGAIKNCDWVRAEQLTKPGGALNTGVLDEFV